MTARAQLARVRGAARSLAPTRRTSLWEVGARRPPSPEQFRAWGHGAVIVPPATVEHPELVSVGAGVLLHEGVAVLVDGGAVGVEIGAGTRLARYVHIGCRHRVVIGRDVSSSDHAAVVDSWGPVHDHPGHAGSTETTVVEDGAYLGFGCIIGPGVTVGTGAFVGEGAIVIEDVPPHTVVYGNPAAPGRRWTGSTWDGPRFP